MLLDFLASSGVSQNNGVALYSGTGATQLVRLGIDATEAVVLLATRNNSDGAVVFAGTAPNPGVELGINNFGIGGGSVFTFEQAGVNVYLNGSVSGRDYLMIGSVVKKNGSGEFTNIGYKDWSDTDWSGTYDISHNCSFTPYEVWYSGEVDVSGTSVPVSIKWNSSIGVYYNNTLSYVTIDSADSSNVNFSSSYGAPYSNRMIVFGQNGDYIKCGSVAAGGTASPGWSPRAVYYYQSTIADATLTYVPVRDTSDNSSDYSTTMIYDDSLRYRTDDKITIVPGGFENNYASGTMHYIALK